MYQAVKDQRSENKKKGKKSKTTQQIAASILDQ